jgi:excinuclease UvrABC nuclease subunit
MKSKYSHTFFEWKNIDNNETYVSREIVKNEILKKSILPITPGCYVWIYKNEVIYIGRSSNIQNRLGNHIFSKISGPRSNAIFTTTARDTIIRYVRDENFDHYRNLSVKDKKSNSEYLEVWSEILEIIENSSFVIYSTKNSIDSYHLEKKLINDFKPKSNNVIPDSIKIRDDFKILGIG